MRTLDSGYLIPVMFLLLGAVYLLTHVFAWEQSLFFAGLAITFLVVFLLFRIVAFLGVSAVMAIVATLLWLDVSIPHSAQLILPVILIAVAVLVLIMQRRR